MNKPIEFRKLKPLSQRNLEISAAAPAYGVATLRLLMVCLVVALGVTTARGQGAVPQQLLWQRNTNSVLAQDIPIPMLVTASSGLAVTLRIDGGLATITAGAITVTGPGWVQVTAEQAGDERYLPIRETRIYNLPQAVLTWEGGLKTPETALKVHVVEDYAYVVDYPKGLVVMDVSRPDRPVAVGRYDTFPASVGDVQVVGNYAYLTENGLDFQGLVVIDVSNPANPVKVGAVNLGGIMYAVQMVDNYAYVASHSNGMQVVDVSEPTNPIRVGGYITSGYAVGLHVVEHYAYVASWTAGLQVLDVSNPTRPTRVGSYNTGGNVVAVQVEGDYAYMADEQVGLQVLDVSNRAVPVRVGGYVTGGTARDVQISGNRVFVASGTAGLQVIDVSRPANPVRAGTFGNGQVIGDVQLAGNFAWVADGTGLQLIRYDIGYQQTLFWEGPTDAVLGLNRPHSFGATASSGLPVSFRVDAGPATIADGKVTVTDLGTVWVTAEQPGDASFLPARATRAFNVRQSLLTRVGGVDLANASRDFQIAGNYAFVTDYLGLHVIDLSDPVRPRRIADLDTKGDAWGLQVVGNYAYVADYLEGLQMIDVSNPMSPIRVGGVNTSGTALAVQVVGNYAYLADGESGLQVIDVSNPARPVVVGGADTSGRATGLEVVGNYVCVADGESGVQVIDVRNPTHPSIVAALDTRGYAVDLRVEGDYAYVADGPAGLQVLDVSSPASPEWVGRLSLQDGATRLAVAGSYVFAAGGEGLLHVIDVGNRADPLRVGGYDSATGVSGVRVVGNYAYVTELEAGLQVFRLEVGYPQTLAWEGNTDGILALNNTPYPLRATASSGQAVTFRVDAGPAQIVDGMLTATGAGTVWVTAEQPGDAAHLPLRETRSFNVRHARLTWVGGIETGGYASGLQVVGNYAYLGDGEAGLQVIDVSQPAKPIWVGGIDTAGYARGIQVIGHYAYVADGDAGLQVIDVSNPTHPVQVGTLDTSGYAKTLQVVDNDAYVADWHAGVQVIDVSQPAHPVWVGRIDTSGRGSVQEVRVVGNYAYVVEQTSQTEFDNFEVFDLSHRGHPILVSGMKTGGSAYGVQVVGHYAYVVGGGGMKVIDVSYEASPVHVGGTYSDSQDIQVLGSYAYVAGPSGVQVIDVSLPAKPLPIGEMNTDGKAHHIQVVGNYVYIADGDFGLQILRQDFGYPQTLTWQGTTNAILSLNTPHLLAATASSGLPVTLHVDSGPATIVDDRIIVTGVGKIVVTAGQVGDASYLPVQRTLTFNVERVKFREVGGINTGESGHALQIVGNYAYVAAGWGGLAVSDVSTPTNPMRLGGLVTGGFAGGVHVEGNHAYVAASEIGLQVVDVSDPARPVQVGGIDTSGSASAVQVVGNYAYVADYTAGLQVIDVSDPTLPVRTGGYQTSGYTSDVQVAGNFAYVAQVRPSSGSSYSGLEVFDVSNPAGPVRVGGYHTSGDAVGVKLVENYAYVADREAGLVVIDVSNPTAPIRVGQYANIGGLETVEVVGNYAYLLQNDLYIVDVSYPRIPVRVEYPFSRSGGRFSELVQIQVVGNYAYTLSDDGRIEILQLTRGYPQNLQFQLPSEVPFQSRPIVSPAASDSGLPLTVSVLSGPARIWDNQLILTGVGQVTLLVEQVGNAEFFPAGAIWSLTVTPPRLEVRWANGDRPMELAWASGLSGLKLQACESLPPANEWQDVASSVREIDGEARVSLEAGSAHRYFRLLAF